MMQADFFTMQNLDIGSLAGFENYKAIGGNRPETRLQDKSDNFLTTLNKVSAHKDRPRMNERAAEPPQSPVRKPDTDRRDSHHMKARQPDRKAIAREQKPGTDDNDDSGREDGAVSERVSEKRRNWELLLEAFELEASQSGRVAFIRVANENGLGQALENGTVETDLQALIQSLQLGDTISNADQASGIPDLFDFISALQNHLDGTDLAAESDFKGQLEKLIAELQIMSENSNGSGPGLHAGILEKLQQLLQLVNPTLSPSQTTAAASAWADMAGGQTSGAIGESQGVNAGTADLDKLMAGLTSANPVDKEGNAGTAAADVQSGQPNSKPAIPGAADPAKDSQGQKQPDFNSQSPGGNPKFSNHEAPADQQGKHGLQLGGNPDASNPMSMAGGAGYNLAVEEAKSNMGPQADVSFSNELDAKLPASDVSAKDNGIIPVQGQGPDKATEVPASTREAEMSRGATRSQTLDQIVQKATLLMKNGQHEVRIDLKPEYLGHVRLQITTENQLVTLKVLTEMPMVKEMIESSLHQLKADLQQQGLEIDKLDVTVTRDGNQFGGSDSRMADNRLPSNKDNGSMQGDLAEEEVAPEEPSPKTESESEIDYFV
jgi:flagellar hook-length control protein FliK